MVFDKAKLYTGASSIKDPIGKLQGRLWSLLAQITETSKAMWVNFTFIKLTKLTATMSKERHLWTYRRDNKKIPRSYFCGLYVLRPAREWNEIRCHQIRSQ